MEGKNIKEALKSEAKFFQMSDRYAAIAMKAGTPYLCRALSQVIVKHIKKSLPIVRSKITSILYQKEKEIKHLQVSKVSET